MNSWVPNVNSLAPSLPVPAGAKTASRISRQLQWKVFIFSLVVVDALMIGLAFRAAYFIRFERPLPVFQLDVTPSLAYYQTLTTFLVLLWLAAFKIAGLYDRQHLLGGTEEYSLVFRTTTVSLLIVIVAGFLGHGLDIARGWLVLAWGLIFLFVGAGRFGLRRVAYSLRERGYFVAPAVIVGANEEGRHVAAQLLDARASGLRIVGFVDEKYPAGTVVTRNLPVLGAVEQLDEIIREYGVEDIFLAASAISCRNNLMELFRRYGVSSAVNVHLSSGLYEIMATGLTVQQFACVPFVGINKVRLTGADLLLKFLLDYTLASLVLLFTWPVYLLIALVIKFDSPGPVIHRRRVMGVNGRFFDAFKFRTMVTNGDEVLAAHPELQAELARTHKLKNDPRITRVGRFLRKLSLDELPQIFNVLRGEMSLVGPRMISPAEMEMYQQWGLNLLTVKPGITGLWQVSGRSDVTYAERVRLDMHYIRNWTIWLDLQLLMQTIPVVINGHGAY
jgi:exopolysaccharide biosynthesis polyprenyl glycosylphosphotransferase